MTTIPAGPLQCGDRSPTAGTFIPDSAAKAGGDGVARSGILCESLASMRCKCLIVSNFLFEWKTSV